MKTKTEDQRDWDMFLSSYKRIRLNIIKNGGTIEMRLKIKYAIKQKRKKAQANLGVAKDG